MPSMQAVEAQLAAETAKRMAAEEEAAALAAGLTEAVAVIDDQTQRLAVCTHDALPLHGKMPDATHQSRCAAFSIEI